MPFRRISRPRTSKVTTPVNIVNPVNLHGYLEIDIRAGRTLPNMDGRLGRLSNKNDVSDPFVDVRLDNMKIFSTCVIDNNLNPVWNEKCCIHVCHFANNLMFEIKDKVI